MTRFQVNCDSLQRHEKCPHCKQGVRLEGGNLDMGTYTPTGASFQNSYHLNYLICPLCNKLSLELDIFEKHIGGGYRNLKYPLYPLRTKYDYAPKEVPPLYAKDYNEAVQTLAISPNASSALSRRCLQSILRHELKIKGKGNLDKQIEIYLKTNPPSYIKDTLHRIRKAGAIAVHPFTHKTTGEIIEATPEIAEYTIVALQKIFDLLFVEPAKTKAQEAEIDKLYDEKSK